MLWETRLVALARAAATVAVNSPLIRPWQAHRLRSLVAAAPQGKVRLNLGCGGRPFAGWINIDLLPSSPGPDVLLDLCRAMPLPDQTVDLIYSEDVLEHLTLPDGKRLLRECHRILVPGGTMRLLTPNLRVLAEDYVDRSQRFLAWYGSQYGTRYFAEILNHGMRAWGHRFVYDDEMLTRELAIVGFDVEAQAMNKSDCAGLRGLDREDRQEARYRMYLDCTKRWTDGHHGAPSVMNSHQIRSP